MTRTPSWGIDGGTPMLAVRGVTHQRGGRPVLTVDDLAVARGERVAVLGPNGAGKTTLLRLLAAVEPPTRGQVLVDGRDPAALPRHELLALRRTIGYLTQRPALLAGTVTRNVELPLRWRRVGRGLRRDRARAALDRLGVAHLAGRRADRLSGGEAQRVALARALVTDPQLLLLDEPATALDPEARAAFLTDVEQALADRCVTLVHVTHRADEALRVADRVIVLVDGAVRQAAPVREVLHAPVDGAVARLIGYENVLDVTVDDAGRIRVGNCVLLRDPAAAPGGARLAAWATGVAVRPTEGQPAARVESVRHGPGRWELRLDAAGQTVVAHLPPGAVPPRRGDLVALTVAPGVSRLLSDPSG